VLAIRNHVNVTGSRGTKAKASAGKLFFEFNAPLQASRHRQRRAMKNDSPSLRYLSALAKKGRACYSTRLKKSLMSYPTEVGRSGALRP
jgi:hypothetical protein